MGQLQKLAWEAGADERTLRRAVIGGTVRCRRPSPRRLEVSPEERAYLREHWPLLANLRQALRTEPNVRFAALFGSVARGTETAASDLDVVIDLKRHSRHGSARLRDRLHAVSGREVQLVHLADVEESAPDLLGEIVTEGRVLVDRDRCWPRLQRRRWQILERAREAGQELLAAEREIAKRLEREGASP